MREVAAARSSVRAPQHRDWHDCCATHQHRADGMEVRADRTAHAM